MIDWIDAISTIGFPIFVAGWLLVRSDKREEMTREAIAKNTEILIELKGVLKRRR